MSIKKAIYKIKNASGYDAYHFESDNGQIQVLDSSNKVLGTIKEFAQEGKVVTSGKVTDLKTNGLYKIKNVTGLPSEVDVSKISILAVTGVGATGSPEMLKYELVTQSGAIYDKIVVPGSSSTEWTNGGTKLENSINTLIQNFGILTSLNTSAKATMVGAINEVNTNLKTLKSTYDKHILDYNTFKDHNHDDRYIKKSGDKVSGNLIFSVGAGLSATNSSGTVFNMMKQNASGEFELGNPSIPMNIYGSNIYHNGKKIWTEANDGKGSGLDADKFQGKDASLFAQTDTTNTFTSDNVFTGGKSIIFQSDSAASGMFWRNSKGNTLASIRNDGSNGISFYNGTTLNAQIQSDGKIVSKGKLEFDGTNTEGDVIFKISPNDKGMGMYRNNSSKYLGFYDWDRAKRLAYFDNADGFMYLDNAPSITGRRLFLQSGTPGGSIPEGSIWIS